MGNPGLFVYILRTDQMRAVEYRVEMGGALRSSPSSTKGGGNVSENRARCRMPILVHFEGALLLPLLSCTAGKEGHMSPVRTLISHLGWAHCLTLSLAAPLLRRAGRSVGRRATSSCSPMPSSVATILRWSQSLATLHFFAPRSQFRASFRAFTVFSHNFISGSSEAFPFNMERNM